MNEASKPYVGLIVDFYPDNSTRIPAMVLEVYPDSSSEGQSLRPKLDLKCFKVPEIHRAHHRPCSWQGRTSS